MANKIEELKKDIAEIENFETHATRQKIKDYLSVGKRKFISELIRLEDELKKTESSSESKQATVKNTQPAGYEVKLNNYAWDQSQKFVKFYITLPKVNTVPAENVQVTFNERSLEVRVKNLENKDFLFSMNHLLHPVEPKNSTYKVKNDLILINCSKKDDIHWSHVTEWEKKANEKKMPQLDPDEKADPSASLMSLMKNMYESGDDEMKRTIAKAWQEGQNKAGPPMF